MTRSRLFRIFTPLLTLSALLGLSISPAQGARSEDRASPRTETSALEITDKTYDEESGMLVIVLQNKSDVTVTAFAVSLVSSDSTGSGATLVRGEEMYLGDGIAPGASYEMKIALAPPGQDSLRFHGRAVTLDHEIRSDNSSYGNPVSAEKLFKARAAYFIQVEKALTRLRGLRGASSLQKSALSLLREEAQRGKEARRALLEEQHVREPQLDRPSMAAVVGIGDLADQTVKRIEAGDSVEQATQDLELVLEDQLARTFRNIRRDDLEGFER